MDALMKSLRTAPPVEIAGWKVSGTTDHVAKPIDVRDVCRLLAKFIKGQ